MTIRGPTLEFSNGVKMPQVGLGTWQSTDAESKTAINAALDAGYRLIDTATAYENEQVIGDTIREAIAAGKIKRADVFITTKLWPEFNHPDDVEQALRRSLKLLQLDYVDLYLLHFPTCVTSDFGHRSEVKVEDTWKAFEEIYNKGLAKSIGVCNCSVEQIERIMKIARIPIHNLQVEVHLYWPQHELHEVCKKHAITLTSYASLGSPARANYQAPEGLFEWAPAPSDLDDKNVKALAFKYGKTPAQILLRYCIDRGIAVIPKSNNPKRIAENFNLFDVALTASDIHLLESEGHRQRLFTQDFMTGHPEDPYKAERTKK